MSDDGDDIDLLPDHRSFSDRIRQLAGNRGGYRKRPIADFVNSDEGLKQPLFPVQKAVLRLINNEPLDREMPTLPEEQIRIWHPIEQQHTYKMTERNYAEWLFEQKRLNIHPDEIAQAEILEYLLPWGRRGTKSTLVSALIAYELDELLRIPSPQKYFGIAEQDRMAITYVALGRLSAEKLFDKSAKMLLSARSLIRHVDKKPSQSKMKLYTTDDLENPRLDERGFKLHSLELVAHANSPGIRGDNNLTYVCEEFAHFNQSDKSTKEQPLDEMIYDAISPSVSSYKHPSLERMRQLHEADPRYPAPDPKMAGRPYGKGYMISSPLNQKGKFHQIYAEALQDGAESGTLMINLPTWEVNPLVSKKYYFRKWKNSPTSFKREYGAEFIKGGTRWIDNMPLFYRAWDSRLNRPDCVGNVNKIYFAGLDFAAANDGVALAICGLDLAHEDLPEFRHKKAAEHWLPDGSPVDLEAAKLSMFVEDDVPGAYDPGDDDDEDEEDGHYKHSKLTSDIQMLNPLAKYELVKARYTVDYLGVVYPDPGQVLNMEDVCTWIAGVVGRFRLFAGIFDQWSGDLVQQELHKNSSLQGIKKVNFGEMLNSEVAKNFLNTLYSDELRLPIDNEEALEEELLGLNETVRKKHIIKVERPASEGHDDLYSAISRAVFLAKTYHTKNKPLLEALLGKDFADQVSDRTILRIGSGGAPLRPRIVAAKLKQQMHTSFTGQHSTQLYGQRIPHRRHRY